MSGSRHDSATAPASLSRHGRRVTTPSESGGSGRSPKVKFIVREPGSEDRIWWGEINHALSEQHFEGLRARVAAHLEQESDLYVVDAFAGADPEHRIAVRVITSRPYHALFART